MSGALPVLLCGQSPQIAISVKSGLLPEYEIIHVCLTRNAAVSEIPGILQGKVPSPVDPENVGSKNYSKPPAAVFFGRGFDGEQFAEIREACKGLSNIVWLKPDMNVETPPLSKI
ncbi:MAG: hypothetical protein MMC33_001356 [Icmadophila ericetorum]|nr:hypothetical protein [Icmadophila ericetorum]